MVLLFVEKLEQHFRVVGVKLPTELTRHYNFIFDLPNFDRGLDIYVRVHVSRVFNEEGNVVKEVNENLVVKLEMKMKFTTYVLDLTEMHLRYSIPIGYFLEVLLISLIVKSGSKQYEMLVYPDEFKYSISPFLPQKVSNLVESYARVLRERMDYEVVVLLSTVGLQDISADLWEGLVRYYGNDYEGSIKFFRKVVEGLRKIANKTDVIEEGRKERLHRYLSSAYDLISSFGEHAGTRGSLPEARLSRDIALSTSRYLAEYLKQSSQKQAPSTA